MALDTQFNPTSKLSAYGNFFFVGLSGCALDNTDKRILQELRPAGVLLLKRNFDHTLEYSEWIKRLADLISEVKLYTGRDKMFVTLDHEGGRVHRVPSPISHFPSPFKYRSRVADVAKAMATELKSLGVNVSWAPLADIHSNPQNPIIGDRAFGSSPQVVEKLAVEYAAALLKEEVLCCAKHYPGHGDTSTDSHLELPRLEISETELRKRELIPFKGLADLGVPFFMTAHILFPMIDKHYPATLSEHLLKGILRDEWGYNGIIVSDDLDMKAVSDGFKNEEAIAQAFKAGCNMFIVARHPDAKSERPLLLAEQIVRALRRKLLAEEQLEDSFLRVQRLLNNTKMHDVQLLPTEILHDHSELAKRLN